MQAMGLAGQQLAADMEELLVHFSSGFDFFSDVYNGLIFFLPARVTDSEL